MTEIMFRVMFKPPIGIYKRMKCIKVENLMCRGGMEKTDEKCIC